MKEDKMPGIVNQRMQSGIKNQAGRQSQNNLLGINNSRRNISFNANILGSGNSRPKTAAVTGLLRPPTGMPGIPKGGRGANNITIGAA